MIFPHFFYHFTRPQNSLCGGFDRARFYRAHVRRGHRRERACLVFGQSGDAGTQRSTTFVGAQREDGDQDFIYLFAGCFHSGVSLSVSLLILITLNGVNPSICLSFFYVFTRYTCYSAVQNFTNPTHSLINTSSVAPLRQPPLRKLAHSGGRAISGSLPQRSLVVHYSSLPYT